MLSLEICLRTESWVVVSSTECFGTEFQVFAYNFVPWKGIPNCFLFRVMVKNGIPSVCFQFCSMVQISEHFSPLRNGFGTEFREFSVPRNSRNSAGIPPEQTKCSVYSVFSGIIFCRKLPTLVMNSWSQTVYSTYTGFCQKKVKKQTMIDLREISTKLFKN